MLLAEIVHCSQRVASTRARGEKTGYLAEILRHLAPEEIGPATAYLAGELPQGRLGIGPATLIAARTGAPAEDPSLTIREVDRVLDELARIQGPGSTAHRRAVLSQLLRRATPDECDFLSRLILGELRQGALEGIMLDSVAVAAEVPRRAVRRAFMFAGDLAEVARHALTEGVSGLEVFSVRLFQPLKPMLAQPAESIDDAFTTLDRAGLEYKLDGARVQVHLLDGEVRVFSRRLNEVTAAVPELVERVRELPVRSLVLDGETLALRADGSPQPFQVTMRRFGRKLDVERVRRTLPLVPFFFDCLYLDDESLVDRSAEERFDTLQSILPAEVIVPRTVTDDRTEAEAFLETAIAKGHEGVMVKSLESAYEAGGRGRSWLKLKPAHTLDLVVLAAEWGHGRREGFLSNLHLGARDLRGGGFVMLGKTFKGMTDALLRWQTEALLALEVERDRYTVTVRPELVVEVAFSDIQRSRQYPGGVALRFARLKGYRRDKSPLDADTIDTVRSLLPAEPHA